MGLLEIIFVVVMIIMIVAQPYPGSPFVGYAWGTGILAWIAMLCLGLALFGGMR
jgi:Flp pilus assembly protein protease CpaA